MINNKIITEVQISKNVSEVFSFLDEVFSENLFDEVFINILIDDIQKTINSYKPENNYGTTPSILHIEGESYKLVHVIENLRYAIEKLRQILAEQHKETKKLVLSESELPEFLSDAQLAELLNYKVSSIPAKRSRGELPKNNDFGFTSTSDLFKFLRENSPSYISSDEEIQQLINRRRKR